MILMILKTVLIPLTSLEVQSDLEGTSFFMPKKYNVCSVKKENCEAFLTIMMLKQLKTIFDLI